jgi:pyruvate dehydrogenase E2 component (dihydrolipoamide acetyltransferase)
VLKEDVMRAVQGAPLMRPPVGAPSKPVSIVASHEERKPFVGLRRKIAERMQHAKRTAAHFTFVEELDVSVLIATRERLQGHSELRDTRLSFLPFIVKSVVAALKKHPILNCYLDETKGELVFRYDYHIGIATATSHGLMVPVLTHADRRGLREIALEIERLSQAARAMTISAEELSGSTFTITSLGKQGGLMATPVLNMPEVGIMGVHRIRQRPVVRNGEIVVGDVMTVSFTFDHRIVDGHVGAAFAYDVIAGLEEPTTLLL